MEYLAGLNDAQRQAVLTTEGPVSVLACAGSGKTRVLTTRIYHLIRSGVLPANILAVTFTNKAAREMRERVAKLLGVSPEAYQGGKRNPELPFIATFHGLGREILETQGRVLGIARYFQIFDRDDSERAIKEALKTLAVDAKEVPPRLILSVISKAKGKGESCEAWSAREGKEHFRKRIIADAWLRYEDILTREHALDFDDLIAKPVELLTTFTEVRNTLQKRFTFVHVDEYQDTSVLQGNLINLLSGEKKNVFVVGDIDQTIYTWRDATIENLLEFEKHYPNATTIVLEQNYRSSKNIVEAANAIIKRNKKRKEKHSTTDNPRGRRILVHAAQTGEEESVWIAEQVRTIISTGIAPETIAVLFRTNFQSRLFEEAFLHAHIPYRLLGTRFFDRKEVKDVLSWIRLAMDPERESDRMRAVQFPPRGIGKVLLGKLAAGKRAELRGGELAKVEAFEHTLQILTRAAKTQTPSQFVRLVIEKSGIEEALKKGAEDDLERLQNARELATLASRYDAAAGEEGIAAFLSDASLASDQDELDRGEKRGVVLMTVHAAKGLEFDTVFIAGLEEGLFPHEGFEDDEERDEEEERRLFYVAVTRAMHALILTFARVRRIYGTDYLSEPSSFLSDIDTSLMVYSHASDDEPSIEV